MNSDVLDIVKALSATDEKTLTQKTLKLGEEFGELAKAVLPYENGFATTHRFVTTRKILEEVADVMLCALSIGYDLGFDDNDLSDMMKEKSFYWNKRQQDTINGRFPLPFELHVTIRVFCEADIEAFKQTCLMLKVKPIVLDLKPGLKDVMTSSVVISDNKGAYDELCRIANGLKSAGFVVLREKVETVPWHPGAPKTKADPLKPNCYFESHVNIVVTEEQKELLQEWCDHSMDIQGHLSKNVFKKLNDTEFVQMLTIRSSTITGLDCNNAEDFIVYVNSAINTINSLSFLKEEAVLKHVVEYAIYDTKVSHDTAWINA